MKPTGNKQNRDDSATDSQEESDSDYQKTKYGAGAKNEVADSYYFKNIKVKGMDTVDALPKNLLVKRIDFIGIIVSIISFIADVVLDILLACFHYYNGNMSYFYMTVACIAIPSLVMTAFSLRWYLNDADEKNSPPVSSKRWALRILFLLFQIGPILRYIDSFRYAWKSNKSKDNRDKQIFYYKRMIYEDADAALLRLFECFMEAAPQLILQLYIFAQSSTVNSGSFTKTDSLQLFSIFASLISMSWSLGTYHRALRYSLEEKCNMSWIGTLFQVIWHFFIIGSRVLALALFASVFPRHAIIFCSVHYIVMTVWIISMRTQFCENRCEEFFYNFVLGIMFIFCYFNPKDSPTRRRYTFYYICAFLENIFLMVLWFINCPPNVNYKLLAIITHFMSFSLGLIFMIIYYLLLHPTGNIKVWAHWSKNKSTDVVFQNGDCSNEGCNKTPHDEVV